MTTYTESQKAQLITFYQQWLPHVESFGYDNLPPGTHAYYRHGKKFFKEQQAAEAAAKKARRADYTDSEVSDLCHFYINLGGDRKAAQAEFFKKYPATEHSASSVWLKLSKIRTFDRTCPGDTELVTDRQVAAVLASIDADRFAV